MPISRFFLLNPLSEEGSVRGGRTGFVAVVKFGRNVSCVGTWFFG